MQAILERSPAQCGVDGSVLSRDELGDRDAELIMCQKEFVHEGGGEVAGIVCVERDVKACAEHRRQWMGVRRSGHTFNSTLEVTETSMGTWFRARCSTRLSSSIERTPCPMRTAPTASASQTLCGPATSPACRTAGMPVAPTRSKDAAYHRGG